MGIIRGADPGRDRLFRDARRRRRREHSVHFIAEDEIPHPVASARDAACSTRGAVAAARWVAGRPPGQYDMRDVLGFSGRVSMDDLTGATRPIRLARAERQAGLGGWSS